MSRLRTTLADRRRLRARLREERALERLLTRAPTVESVHELHAIAARR
ncbi:MULTISPECIES: hypothetical protein [unclassified Geodermatophilus]